MQQTCNKLDPGALQDFPALRYPAIEGISSRFESEFPEFLERFGERGMSACREDIGFTIDFLRPVLEFGLLQPFVQYTLWFRDVLEARGISSEHIARLLQWMEEFYRDNLPAEAAGIIAAVLGEARSALSISGDTISGIDASMPEAWEEYTVLYSALLEGDHRKSRWILEQHIDKGASLLEVEIHLLQPALYQVGRDWQAARISVAQEHLATTTATMVMAQLWVLVAPPVPIGAKILLACVEGNHHAVGLRMVGDCFEQEGWEVKFLGSDVPVPSLIDEVTRNSPDLIGLSVSMPYQLKAVRETLYQLHAAYGEEGPAVIMGGLAVNSLPALADLFGIPSAGDAGGAITTARMLVERRG